jgi:hypothetical protein
MALQLCCLKKIKPPAMLISPDDDITGGVTQPSGHVLQL